MAASKIGWEIWFVGLALFWSLYPLVFTQTRSVLILCTITALFTLFGRLWSLPVLVAWSGGVGLCNLTLALLLASHPPDLGVGLSAGILLFALVDSSQRLTYLRPCWIAPGVVTALLRPLVLLSGVTLLVGIGIGWLVVHLSTQATSAAQPGFLTAIGACLLAGFLALFLLYTNRLSDS
jgi:hypothetical protein